MGLFRRKRRRDDEPVDLDDRAPQTGVKFKDLLVLDQLARAGADLTQPRHVVHYLYFSGAEVAAAAGGEAVGRGFEIEVRDPRPEAPGAWSLVCQQHDVVLDLPKVRDDGDFFDGLAARHGGEYDGWEASV